MADVKVKWFGWMFAPQDGHDKVWGWLEVGGTLYNFWAARGGKIAFKAWPVTENINPLIRSKMKKGYREVAEKDIEDVYPEFYFKVQRHLFAAKMKDTVR